MPWSTFAPEQCVPNNKEFKGGVCISATNVLSKYDLMNFKKLLKRRLALTFFMSEDDFIGVHGERDEL